MGLLTFILSKKIQVYFKSGNYKVWFLDLIFLSSIIIFSNTFIKFYSNETIISKEESIISLIYLLCFLVPLFLKVFSTGLNKCFFLSKHYPIKQTKLIFLDLISNNLNFKNITVVLSFLWILINYEIDIYVIINAILLFVIGNLNKENLVNALIANKTVYFIWITLLFFSSVYMLSIYNYFMLFILLILVFIVSVCVYFYYYSFINSIFITKQRFSKISNQFTFLLSNKVIRNSFLTTIFFKIVTVLYLSNNSTDLSDNLQNTYLVLCLPATMFTFIYNNTWGYYRSLALNLIIAGISKTRFLFYFIKIVFPVLLIDFIASIILLIIINEFNVLFLIWFLIFSVYAINLAYISSFIEYKNVSKSISMISIKRNTSVFFNFFTILGVVPFFLFNSDNRITYFYLIIPLMISSILILSFIFYCRLTDFTIKLLEFK